MSCTGIALTCFAESEKDWHKKHLYVLLAWPLKNSDDSLEKKKLQITYAF